MAAATVRGVGTVAAGAVAIQPGLPTGTEVGDLLLCFIESGGLIASGEASTAPPTTMSEGWTKIEEVTVGNTKLTVFYQVATVKEPARAVNDTGDHQIARIV